ncbi:MAG: winged helix-turn-helix domain-containing protein [Dokdonella sp.]|uniref:winged helix-turn-helix domain-containing protein n=1 Tax=Dokdonella sp. TaxID=2291710 RepID=UPI003F804E37
MQATMVNAVYRFGDFRLDTVKRELRRGDEPIEVPARAFACLTYLIEHRERAVPQSELIAAVWRRDNVSDTQLFQLILRARRLVGDSADRQEAIRTIAGFGYRWVVATTVETNGASDAGKAMAAPMQEAAAMRDGAGPAANTADVGADATKGTPVPATASSALAMPPSSPDARNARSAAQRARRMSRNALAGVLMVLALASIALALFLRHRADTTAPPSAGGDATLHVAVRPLEVGSGPDVAWVRLGGMDLVADRLRRAQLAVLPSEATLGVLTAGKSDADGATMRLRRDAGIGLIVDGHVARDHAAWNVALHGALDGTRDVQASATDNDLVGALRRASDQLIVALGRDVPAEPADAGSAERLQRVRAALLADDPASAKTALESLPEAQRGDGETRLLHAQVEQRLGHYEAAEKELTDLLERKPSSDDAYQRMRVFITRGTGRIRLGRAQEARADFDGALAAQGAGNYEHALGEAYLGRGASSTIANDYAAAADDLGRARVVLAQSGDRLAVARADLEWALLDSARGAAAQAMPRYEAAARQFEAFAAMRPLKSALIGLQDVQLDQLQNHAALATSDRTTALAAGGGDPLLLRVLTLMRARILLACGQLRAVHDALAQVEAGDQGYLALSRDDLRIRVLRVELALAEGRRDDAAREAAPLPASLMPEGADDTLQAKANLWRQRVLPPTAAEPGTAIAPSTRTDAGSRAGAPYRRLAEAERAFALGHTGDADRAWRQALDLADADGTPRTMARVIQSWATALIALGRLGDAAALAGRVGAWAADDYDCALLQLRLAHALGEPTSWRNALAAARELAGERVIPVELTLAPTPRATDGGGKGDGGN